MKTKPVIIEYTKNVPPSTENPTGFLKGAMFEVPTPAMAKKYHPDAHIDRYADGESYSEPKAPAPRKTRKKAASTRKTAAKAPAPSTTTARQEADATAMAAHTLQDAVEAPVTNGNPE